MDSPAVSIGQSPDFALALSGGGVRAMVFHLGVLKYLAEQNALERVSQVSTVSGGSLLVGLMLHENGGQWPASTVFLQTIYPRLREQLCSRSLLWSALRQLLNPLNWRFILSRANLLELGLRNEWGVTGLLSEIGARPDWSINGTTAENGKRFRFKRTTMGDYSIGYAATLGVPLAKALAVSAAFPGGIGPLALDSRRFKWMQRGWNAPLDSAVEATLPFPTLHLYDGGVYDNLGLEPFFDAATGRSKRYEYPIVVSDAGAPLKPGFQAGMLSPWRLKRLSDIMSDQSRALRTRTFVEYLNQAPGRGGYLGIASALIEAPAGSDAAFAASFATSLDRLEPEVFDRIARHGHAVAQTTDRHYAVLLPPAVTARPTAPA
ncbi:patatin-like phospholipase family protein [Pseudomonas gingeri]|uniref:patatin-like phospholipase family protein n=1 Tax=Pseudomonas gingeri TaxID=117681 RepID=UPI0015A3E3C8|nr:patatin-like phospholipase family protein [Pseudomonas gingeri]NWE28767.1 patatin-like phospholipase family protein [Pseudomonas gingeri]NWE97204.1 patatin-like phospholipase family protein [Pseudomonas gingeri]